MPDFSHMGPSKGLPPINNFRPASSAPEPKPVANPLQELEKSRGPDYVNNDQPGAWIKIFKILDQIYRLVQVLPVASVLDRCELKMNFLTFVYQNA